MSFFNELRRRNVLKVGIAYVVVAWILVQVVNNIAGPLNLPKWTPPLVIVLLGVGLPIALIVAWAFELTPEGVKSTLEADREAATPSTASSGRKLDFVIIGALVLALGYFVWDRYYGAPPQQTTAETTHAGTASAATMPSLAVLPFVDFSPNKDQGYLADGLSDELMDKLAQLKGLALTGRTSTFAFKGKNEDLRTIGKKLGVENVLEGSLRKDGDQIRVTAQLINAKTGYHIWSQTYQRKFDDIFAIQDDISKSVAKALSITLGVGDALRVPGMTHNVRAYDEFLRAQAVSLTLGSGEDARTTVGHLERAVAIDPNFAIDWMVLSNVYGLAATGALPIKLESAAAKSEDAFKHARKLIPNSPVFLVLAANRARVQGRWLEADRLYRSALSAAAGNSSIATRIGADYGVFLNYIGREKDAVNYLESAVAADPLALNLVSALARAYVDSGNTAASLAETDRGMTLEGDQSDLKGTALLTALASGDRTEIDKRLKLVLASPPSIKFLNVIAARMGQLLDDRKTALRELRRLANDPAARLPVIRGSIIADWAAALGDPEYAIEQLRSVPVETQRIYVFTVWHPVFEDMRKLPGFKDYLRDVGFVDYWRKTGHWGDFCHPVGENDFECL